MPSINSTPAVLIRGVTKTFGPKLAVQDLDLSIEQGSLCGFIGPNGAGKTTTIRMIMSIIFPDKGEISVLGKASAIESKDRIGYLPEERGLYRKMKVGPFLTYLGRLKGMDASVASGQSLESRVKTWLDRLGLKDCFRKKCEELSKGMQQKVQFIAAVLHEPDLIILDEVFSGLDPVNRRLMRGLIDEQHKSGRTIIFSTHAMFEAEQLCTHLFMVNKGQKVLDGTLDGVLSAHNPRAICVELMPGSNRFDLSDWASWPEVEDVRAVDLFPPVTSPPAHLVPEIDRHSAPIGPIRSAELRLRDMSKAGGVMARLALQTAIRGVEIKRASLEEIFIEQVGGDAEALRAEMDGLRDVDGMGVYSSSGVES